MMTKKWLSDACLALETRNARHLVPSPSTSVTHFHHFHHLRFATLYCLLRAIPPASSQNADTKSLTVRLRHRVLVGSGLLIAYCTVAWLVLVYYM